MVRAEPGVPERPARGADPAAPGPVACKAERGVRRLDVLELRAWAAPLGMSFPAFATELDERLASLETLQRHARPGGARHATPKRR